MLCNVSVVCLFTIPLFSAYNLTLNKAVDLAQNCRLWRLMSVWRYALLVVHARKEEEEDFSNCRVINCGDVVVNMSKYSSSYHDDLYSSRTKRAGTTFTVTLIVLYLSNYMNDCIFIEYKLVKSVISTFPTYHWFASRFNILHFVANAYSDLIIIPVISCTSFW